MDRDSYVPSALAGADVVASGGDGSAEGEWTLVFVKDLRHSPHVVWAALTEPSQLDEWAPFRADRNLAALGDATLAMVDGESEVPLAATVLRVEEPTLLEYTWGDDTLRWSLAVADFGTRLTLQHTTRGQATVPMVAAGWHICLDVMALLLDREPIGVIRGNEALEFGWQTLHDAYAEKLGIGGGK